MIRPVEMKETRPIELHEGVVSTTDEEYRSTPLGYAARRGRREMVAFLLGRGADVNKSGAPWARPLAWVRKKDFPEIEADLRQAGAQ